MLTLVTTAGSPTANSYVTVEQATLLLDGRLNIEPWYTPEVVDEATAVRQRDRRLAALAWATRLLDEQVQWFGTPTTTTQALAWPMTGQRDQYGRDVPTTSIPLVLQQATAFYALALLRDVSEDLDAASQAEVQSERVGDVQIVYRQRTTLPVPPMRGLPFEIRAMLRWYGSMTGSIAIPLVRV